MLHTNGHVQTIVAPQLRGQGGRCPYLQGVQVVDIPVVTQRLIHMVSLTIEIPQLRVDMWSVLFFFAGRASRASFTGAGCGDHSRDPTVAAH